ncbi:unnamed protein product [Caenorhabditis brenneri]
MVLTECDYDCDCADLMTLFRGPVDIPIFHTKGAKCFNNFTVTGRIPYAAGMLDNSEAIYPSEPEEILIVVKVTESTSVAVPTEFFEPLGLVCENKKWFITKFPLGISDKAGQCLSLECLSANEANGKGYKAELLGFSNS